MMRRSVLILIELGFILFIVGISSGSAEVRVSDIEIVVGQSAALTGPAQALGKGMKAGMEVYFKYINAQGGINGRRIRLISYDDGYEPTRCVDQTRRLIKEGVFALIGFVGTPTSNVAVPVAQEEKIPYIGPFTGAEFLRNPVKHYVINIRGSYYDETEGLVKHLVDDLGIQKIACFYQDDSYGRAGLEGVQRALKKRNMELASEDNYPRNTLAVKGGLMRVKKGNPEAIIMIGAYAPCAEFIKLTKEIGMKGVRFCNVSFVGSAALKEALGDAGEGVIISQVVPFPWDKSIPVVEEYHRLFKEYFPEEELGFVSLEGFMVAKFFVQAVKAAGPDLTREGLIYAIERKGKFDLGGITLTFSSQDHQGMDEIHFTVIEEGAFRSITTFK